MIGLDHMNKNGIHQMIYVVISQGISYNKKRE